MKTRIHNWEYPALVLALVLLSAVRARAQSPTQALGELQDRIRIGENIQVIDGDGKKTEGKFDGVSAASIRLIADGARQEFRETQIREVRKRRQESKWDGVLIGLGIGAVAGAWNVTSTCSGASERGDCLAVGWAIVFPLFVGGGAGAGALVDFAIRKHEVVFTPAQSSYRFRVAPILDTPRKGVALSVSF